MLHEKTKLTSVVLPVNITSIEEDASGIHSIESDNISVYNISNGISIESNIPISVSIINISGQKVYESKIQGCSEIPLKPGNYIVKVNDLIRKITVL